MGEDSGESEWWVAGVGGGCVEWGFGRWRRYWPGGGRGGIPLEGIASPGVGRIRLEEPRRIGRQARMTRAIPSVVVAEKISSFFEAKNQNKKTDRLTD